VDALGSFDMRKCLRCGKNDAMASMGCVYLQYDPMEDSKVDVSRDASRVGEVRRSVEGLGEQLRVGAR
jgi:hypothetical protein